MMKFKFSIFFLSLIIFFSFSESNYAAGVILGGTRLIYNAENKTADLMIRNTDSKTVYLVQSWVENFKKDDKQEVPFVVIPPLFKIDAGKESLLRIKIMPNNLPDNKESIFWLNVKSVAGVEHKTNNTLQINVNSKIKLIYRPQGLNISMQDAIGKIKIVKSDRGVKIINPSPYYINIYSLKLNNTFVDNSGVIEPFSEQYHNFDNVIHVVSYQVINDYGSASNIIEKNF